MVVIDASATIPPVPDGREIMVPVYFSYASQSAQDPNWGRAWFSPKASHWEIGSARFDALATKPFQRGL